MKSADATLTVTGGSELQRKGTAYIVTIGVNRYSNEQFNLKYAVTDASTFGQEMQTEQSQLRNYGHVKVIVLTDADATRQNILKALCANGSIMRAIAFPKCKRRSCSRDFWFIRTWPLLKEKSRLRIPPKRAYNVRAFSIAVNRTANHL